MDLRTGDGPALETAQEWLQDAREMLDRWNHAALSFIRARPGVCLASALALGFVAGRLASRR